MNKKCKVITTILVVTLMLNFFSINAAYADDFPPIEAIPPEDVIRNDEPIGTLTSDEIRALKSGIVPQTIGVTYYFDWVYQRYDGYRDRGIVLIAGPNGTSVPNTSTYTITRTISNGYSTSIGASAEFVSANVGYTVTWSESRSWSYTITVNPGQTIYLHYSDWYHVQKFYCHKVNLLGETTYGDGWAEQWYAPQFYTTEG